MKTWIVGSIPPLSAISAAVDSQLLSIISRASGVRYLSGWLLPILDNSNDGGLEDLCLQGSIWSGEGATCRIECI